MTDDERQRWAYVIDDILKGKDVDLLYPTATQANQAFRTCAAILGSISLPFSIGGGRGDRSLTVVGTVRFMVASRQRRRRG